MQKLIRNFRLVLAISMLSGIAAASLDFLMPQLTPSDLRENFLAMQGAMAEQASNVRLIFVAIFSVLILIVGMISTVGLWLLKPWSRRLSLVIAVASFAIAPLLGPSLMSGWALVFFEISLALWGAAIAMVYSSELKTFFEKVGQ